MIAFTAAISGGRQLPTSQPHARKVRVDSELGRPQRYDVTFHSSQRTETSRPGSEAPQDFFVGLRRPADTAQGLNADMVRASIPMRLESSPYRLVIAPGHDSVNEAIR